MRYKRVSTGFSKTDQMHDVLDLMHSPIIDVGRQSLDGIAIVVDIRVALSLLLVAHVV